MTPFPEKRENEGEKIDILLPHPSLQIRYSGRHQNPTEEPLFVREEKGKKEKYS